MKRLCTYSAAAAVLAFGLCVANAAQAVVVTFTTLESGEDLGTTQLATLEAVQSGNDVQFTFTNTLAAHSGSKLTLLLLGYNGTASDLQNIGITDTGGIAHNTFDVGIKTNPSLQKKPITDASNDFDISIGFPTSAASAMNPGESSEFTLTNALLSNMFLGTPRNPFAQIHMQALNDGGSTKYSASVVPLPAALPLLLSAFGGLGFFGWRRRAGKIA